MLELLRLAVAATKRGMVGIDWPVATSIGPETMRLRHRQLLRLSSALDAMDALHIIAGLALGIRSFITFDSDWDTVPGIDTLS